MLPWKLRKRQILPVNQNLSSVYFSLAKFQLVSCNLSLAIIWQMTYTQKLPKLCSATLRHGKEKFAICTSPVIHLLCAPKSCIYIVFSYSWKVCNTGEIQKKVIQHFGGQTRCIIMGDVQMANFLT